jgi:hypothetical protein
MFRHMKNLNTKPRPVDMEAVARLIEHSVATIERSYALLSRAGSRLD